MSNLLINWIEGLPAPKFYKGLRVRYTPLHKQYEDGVVSSVTDRFVFVKYDNAWGKMVTGDEPFTSQATSPEDLIII